MSTYSKFRCKHIASWITFSHLFPAVFHSIKNKTTPPHPSIHDWKLSIWSDRTRWMFCQKLSWFITTMVYIPKCSSGTNKDYARYPSGKLLALCFVFEGSNNKTFLMEKKMKGADESLVWHLRRALLWIPSSATPSLLPQSSSTPQVGHYSPSHPSIRDTGIDHQNGAFNPFHRGHPKDNTHLSYSVTFLEGLW